jgi:hypothetical protein
MCSLRGQHKHLVARLDAGAARAGNKAVGLIRKAAVNGHQPHRHIGKRWRSSPMVWPTMGAPARARTDTRLARPPANSRTCMASGYSTSLPM